MSGCGVDMTDKPIDKRIIVNADPNRICTALVEDGRAVEFHVEFHTDASLMGNIYRGRVQNVLPGMSAAFIDIGETKNAFLNTAELESPSMQFEGENISLPARKSAAAGGLKIGQELMVQVIKEPYGSKGARVSTNITLPGRTVIYMPFAEFVGVSKRIFDASERERLRKIIGEIKHPDAGIIARTAAAECDEAVIASDLNELTEKMRSIRKTYAGAKAPKLIYSETSLSGRIIRDMMKPDVCCLEVNKSTCYEELREAAADNGLIERIELYEFDRDPFKIFDIEKQINEALSRKVWLKSGAYIVIDQTEALVSIDVNTGKNIGKASPGRMIVDTNCEAAMEIARQIRLRNLSGIIIIDFIDMPDRADREKVISTLRKAFKADGARTVVYGMTKLGLIEMARKKSGRTLSEALGEVCPCCGGDGRIIAADAAALKLCDQIRMLRENGSKRFKISAAPGVIEAVKRMESGSNEDLLFETDHLLRNEEFTIKVCELI